MKRFSIIILLIISCGNKSQKPDDLDTKLVCEVAFESNGETLFDRYSRSGDQGTVVRYRGNEEISRVERTYQHRRIVEESYRFGSSVLYSKRIIHSGTTLSIEEIDDSLSSGEPGVDGVIDVVVTIRREGDRELGREIERSGHPKINVVYSFDKRGSKTKEERFSEGVLLESQVLEHDGVRLVKRSVDLGGDGSIDYVYQYEYDAQLLLRRVVRTGTTEASFDFKYDC